MADDTAAALIIQLSADFRDFKKSMQQATGVFDQEGRKIASKQEALKKKLSDWTLDFTGLKGIGAALAGLTAVEIVKGMGDLVKNGLEAASAIQNVATSAGVTTDFLQKMRFASASAGGSFDIMDQALTTLNKNFGEFVNTGGGRAAQAFKTLGIDKLINSGDIRNTEQLYTVLTDKISKFGSSAQQAGFLADIFGKEAGPKMVQLISQGTDAMAKLEAQASSLGIVLSTETIKGAKEANDKLDTLFSVIKAEGIQAVASLAPEIANLAQHITDSLPDLILWVEKWAEWFGLIKLDPVTQLKIQLKSLQDQLANADDVKNSPLLNPLGFMSLNIDAKKREIQNKIGQVQEAIQSVTEHSPVDLTAFSHAYDTKPDDPRLHINDIEGQKRAEQLKQQQEQLAERRRQFLAGTLVDEKTAAAALIAAQDQTQVDLLKGSAGYYDARKKQINDAYKAEVDLAVAQGDKQLEEIDKQSRGLDKTTKDWKDAQTAIANVSTTTQAKIDEANEKRKQALRDAGPDSILQNAQIQADQQVRQLQNEAAQAFLTAGALAKLVFVQDQLNKLNEEGIPITQSIIDGLNKQGDAIAKATDAAKIHNDQVSRATQFDDELASGLEDVGAAGLKGFDNLADAAKNFVAQIAEMILRLYVLKPLLEGLGTSGGGLFGAGGSLSGGGGFFNSILNLFGAGDLGLNTAAAIAANPLLFDGGGYTGPGGKNSVGGIVHKGEVVWSQDDIRRAGGVSVVEAMRRGAKGYAQGGIVGRNGLPGLVPQPPVALIPHRTIPNLVIQIDARYASKGTAEQIREELTRSYPLLVRAAVQESDKKFPTNLSNNLRDRA